MSKESWLWLAGGLGYGAVNTKELLMACPGGPKEVSKELGGIKLDEILTQKQAEKLASTSPENYALMLNHAEAQGIHVLPLDDVHYPRQLHSIANPPPVLFVKGDLTLLNDQLCVGMVGARKPSGYGVEAMRNIGRGVALGGAIIVSGLALGLDSEAHKAALSVNGPTIACIAFGHNTCYPAQNKKLMEVIEQYGAVVSEYPPNQKPEKPFFLHRNRLIAGLSHALLVAEARKHSGTMSTVNFATDYGRDVFAVPGSVFSELSGGTNAMIREGAYLAACAADIMSLYGIELPEEDLSKLAEKQAKEGRPLGALTSDSTRVVAGVTGASDQTLLEAIQGRIPQEERRGEERVSRGAAIDAFRRLQQEIPAQTDSQNRALEEMAAAVSDDVVIQQKQSTTERSAQRKAWEKQLEDSSPARQDKVRPFSWDGVEHLSRKDLQKSEAVPKTPANVVPQMRPYPRANTQRTSHVVVAPAAERVQPAAAVPAVAMPAQTRVHNRAEEVAPPAPAYRVTEVIAPAGTQAPSTNTVPPKQQPVSASQGGGFLSGLLTPSKESGNLAGNLRTMSKPAGEKPISQNTTTDGFKTSPARPVSASKEQPQEIHSAKLAQQLQSETGQPRAEDDTLQTVSEAAKKAFAELGINPSSLAQIVEKSGLSPGEAMAALTELELAGLSRQLPGRQFTIVH